MANTFLRGKTIAVLLGLGLAGLLICSEAGAQKTKGKTRAAETKYLMRGVNQVNCAALGALLKGKGPADDKAWDTAICQASILNEMGYLLMDDGRCPDKAWLGAAKSLREGSAKVLEAAKDRNVAEAQAAFKIVTGACGACHKVHRQAK